MKRITTLFLTCTIASICFSQNVSDRQTINPTWGALNNSPRFNFSSDADKIIAQMMQQMGLKPNFTVRAGRVQNAAATIRRGKRLIEYNPGFISEMNNKGIPAWTYIFILAHEIGHHLNGHTVLKGKKQISAELEADEFAGFMLYKLGATLLQTRMAVHHISNPATTKSHPGSAERIEAVQKGWTEASNF